MGRALKPHDTLTEGDAIGVLMSNHPERVWLYRDDYDRIVRQHGQRSWTWYATGRVARLVLPGGKMPSIARLVLENDGSGFVHYCDDDRLNLRRDRLSVKALKHLRNSWKRREQREASLPPKVRRMVLPHRVESPRVQIVPRTVARVVATVRRSTK